MSLTFKDLRKFTRNFHIWGGVILGILPFLVAFSGAQLSFRTELESLFMPQLFQPKTTITQANTKTILSTALKQGQQTHDPLFRLHYPMPPQTAYKAELQSGRVIFLDNQAKILGDSKTTPDALLFNDIEKFHMTLYQGETGEMVVGFTALGLWCMVLSGLNLLRKKMSWSLFKKRPTFYLHQYIGALFTIPIAIAVFTGMTFAFSGISKPLFSALTHSPAEVSPPALKPQKQVLSPDSLQTVLATAQQQYPQAQIRRLRLPKEPTEPIRVDLKSPTEANEYGKTLVFLDPSKPNLILSKVDPEHGPLAWKLYSVETYPLHSGERFGLWGRVLMTLSAVIVMGLYLSGLGLFVKRMFGRKGFRVKKT
jgi:uncharacterized iron-regulated membrane protein